MRSELLRGHLDALVLAALEPAPAHGYEISRSLRPAEGNVYPALHRLERDGLVVGRLTSERGRRRRVYRLTRAGAEALDVRRLEWRTRLSARA